MANPTEVFLSHFTEEERLAEEVQDFLGLVFGDDLTIFRSSDEESIKTNEPQHQAIMQALRDSKVYIALVSKFSSTRPWLNFEVGHGIGRDAKVFTLLVRGTSENDVPSTLSTLQLRELATVSVIESVISSIEERTGKKRKNQINPQRLIDRVRKAETELPTRDLAIQPFIQILGRETYAILGFELFYTGGRPLNLELVWAEIPKNILDPNWPFGVPSLPGWLNFDEFADEDGKWWLRQTYLARSEPPPVHVSGAGWRPLQPLLMPNKNPQSLKQFSYAIKSNCIDFDEYCRVQAVFKEGVSIPVVKHRLQDIQRR